MKANYSDPKIQKWPMPQINFRDEGIIGIENGRVIYSPDMARLEIKNKLSSLRGKHTKQTEQEINDQINDLRDWER